MVWGGCCNRAGGGEGAAYNCTFNIELTISPIHSSCGADSGLSMSLIKKRNV